MNLENSGKVRRWKLSVQEYNCGVEHVEGKANVIANDFTRLIPHIRKSESNEVATSPQVTSTMKSAPPHPMVESSMETVAKDASTSTVITTPEEQVVYEIPAIE